MDVRHCPIQILLVDDDEDDYTLVRDLLSNLLASGSTLRWARHYAEAMDAIHSGDFDVCLLDHRLGPRTGLEILEEVTRASCQTPIIFLTGHGDYAVDLEAMRLGADDYLTKDQLSTTFLERSIRYTIERRQKRDELYKAKRIIQALSECNDAVIHIKGEPELLREICRIVVEVGGYRMAWVGYAEQDEGQSVTPVAKYGHEEGYLETVKVTWGDTDLGQGPTGTSIRTGMPNIIRSVRDQAEFAPWRVEASTRGFVSVIGLPLLLDGHAFGALTIYAAEPDTLGQEEVDLLIKLSSNLSHGIGALWAHHAHRRAEQSLKEAYIDLERQVEERTTDLVRVNAELKREVEERKRAEETLRFNEKGFRRAEAVAHFGNWEFLMDSNEVIASNGARLIYGLEGPDWSIPYVQNLVLPEYRSFLDDALKGLIGENRPYNVEFKIRRPTDGKIIDIHSIAEYSVEQRSVFGVIHDVTERKRAEEELSEKNSQLYETVLQLEHARNMLQLIIESIPVRVFWKDKDLRYLGCNALFARDAGLSQPEQLLGLDDFAMGWREQAELYRADDRQVMTSGIPKMNILEPLTTTAGSKIWLNTSKVPLRMPNGEIFGVLGVYEDITERRQMAEALSLRESYLTAIIENQPGLLWLKDKESRFLAVNHAFVRSCGRQRPEEVIGKTDLDIWPGELAEKYRDDDREVMTRQGPIAVEERIFDEGALKWFQTFKTPVFTADGQVLGTCGFALDVTERKQAEEALRESKDLYRTLVEASPDAISVTDTNGLLTFASPRALEIYGHSPDDDMIGRSVLDWVASEQRETALNNLGHILTEGAPRDREYTLLKKDGTTFVGEINGATLNSPDGNPKGMLLITRDVTERKRAEEALRESEERFRQLAENINQVFWIANRDMTETLYVSPAYEEIWGRTRTSLYANPNSWLDSVHPEDLHLLTDKSAKRASGSSILEYRIVRPDGSIRWIMDRGFPVRDETGETYRFAGIAEDITERKRLDEEQARVEAQFRQAQKMEALGTLAGGIAHDFNNILGIIFGYTELASMNAGDRDSVRQNLHEVLNASNRAKDLVQQILAFSRRGVHERRPVEVGLIVKEALKMLRATLPSTVEIKKDVASKAVVSADPTQIHQILMNLCTNAAHAMHDGGGVLEVSLTNLHLEQGSIPPHSELQPGPYVKLTVKDTGHGIDPYIIDRIFDPFFTTKEQGAGTGLGLAVVHGIAQSHGGFIDVESSIGKGTTFRVLLPALETAPVASEEVLTPLPRGQERVLLVDDEPSLAGAMKLMLEHLGYEVEYRSNGIEALQAFRDQAKDKPFDLVITDMTMPHMTGTELAQELSKLQPSLPVILCTGFSEKIDAEKVKSLGIQGFLMKPVVFKDLADMVRKALSVQD